MLINPHIVTLSKQLEEAKELVCSLPLSVEHGHLSTLLEEMEIQLVGVSVDLEKALKRVGELAAENYGAILYAQQGAEHYFTYITPLCFQRHMADHVEHHLRKACSEKAKSLWKTIHEYEMMGFLSTQELFADKLFRDLTEHFGRLPYTERTFRSYR